MIGVNWLNTESQLTIFWRLNKCTIFMEIVLSFVYQNGSITVYFFLQILQTIIDPDEHF